MDYKRFQEITKMSQEEKEKLSTEEKLAYNEYLKKELDKSSDLEIPVETMVETGVAVAALSLDTATNATQTITKAVSEVKNGAIPSKSLGAIAKTAIILNMAVNVYNIIKGEFKFDLLGTLNLITTTIACLALVGVNVAALGAIVAVMGSNPFTIAIAVITIFVAYFEIGEAAKKLKKAYLSCYNAYRRIKKLCLIDTNKIIYNTLNSVIDYMEQEITNIKTEIENTDEVKINMKRKIFIGADFNSFVLFNNVITFIQAKEQLSTARDGLYNDYIDFCSIIDYIDTHEILKQDKTRIEYFILQRDTKGLSDFQISLDFLKGYLETYKLSNILTQKTKDDCDYVIKCIEELKNCLNVSGLNNIKDEKQIVSRNPKELFNSIYSYLIYSNAMENSPFKFCSTLLNQEYYSSQNMYEYVSAFSEYPIYLFSAWYFYFGNIMFNNIYIEKYKNQIINDYQIQPALYSKDFVNSLLNDIETFNDYRIKYCWLKSIKEFIKEYIYEEKIKEFYDYYIKSFTQENINQDGFINYVLYSPSKKSYVYDIKETINNFKKYMLEYGNDKNKYQTIFNDLWLFENCNNLFDVSWFGSNWDFVDGQYGVSEKTWRNTERRISNKIDINKIFYYSDIDTVTLLKNIITNITDVKAFIDIRYKMENQGSGNYNCQAMYEYIKYINDNGLINDFLDGKNIKLNLYLITYKIQTGKKLTSFGYEYTYENRIYPYLLNNNDLKAFKNPIVKINKSFEISYNIDTFISDFILKSTAKNYVDVILNSIKNKKDEIKISIATDIKEMDFRLYQLEDKRNDLLAKYPEYDAALSYSYTGKYDVYMWNLYKMSRDLAINNSSYLENVEKFLVPVYSKNSDGDIEIITYYPALFVLENSLSDTELSNAFYLYKEQELNALFNIGDEKFDEKIREYKSVVDLTIQSQTVLLNHNEIIQEIAKELKDRYQMDKDKILELLGSQEEEFIQMQNLQNQEILTQMIKEQEDLREKTQNQDLITRLEDEISMLKEQKQTNEKLADETQNQIKNTKDLLDKNKIIKYALLGLGGFIIASKIKKGKE